MFLSHRENAGAGEAPVPRMAGCGAKASTASGFVDGKPGEGFRMPASRDLSARAEGRRPKASQEGTRGGRATACRLWGFDWAAACLVDALAGVIGGGSTIAVASLAPPRQSTGQFSLIDGIGRAVGGGGATAMRSRKRGSPVGGRCNEAVMS